MSDSDEDRPLAARATTTKISSGLGANGSSAAAQRAGQPSTSAAQDPLKRRAAQKAPVIDESDSEDDQPLAARTKPSRPAARPGIALCLLTVVYEPNFAVKALTLCTQDPGNCQKSSQCCSSEERTSMSVSTCNNMRCYALLVRQNLTVCHFLQPKARPAAVKDEPSSPGVKSEPDTSPQKGTKVKPTRAKKADGEQRVVVKKEYDRPGQTRETPPEIDPLHKFYTTLKQQRPDSEMAKKWCLIHGLLDLEEAEQLVAELKLRKGQTRSPAKAVNGTAGRRSSTGGAAPPKRPAAASSKPAAKRRVMDSDGESDEDDDFAAPARKVQKQGSGNSGKARAAAKPPSRTTSNAQAPGARPSSAGARPGSAGRSGKSAAERPAAKPRPLVASTQKDKAFADGGLDSISDDSDDDKPLGRRMTKPIA
ncbi:TPA: hypothetical protein ACH3X1_005949 [Trebouxia sp. C0004]